MFSRVKQKSFRDVPDAEIAGSLKLDPSQWRKHEHLVPQDPAQAAKALFSKQYAYLFFERTQRASWTPFKRFHYMQGKLNNNSTTFLVKLLFSGSCLDSQIENGTLHVRETDLRICAFTAYMPAFGKNEFKKSVGSNTQKFTHRAHRTVVLPQYQSLGFGSRISDALGEVCALLEAPKGGKVPVPVRMHAKTAHLRFGDYRNWSCLWEPTLANGKLGRRDPDMSNQLPPKEKAALTQTLQELRFFSHVHIGRTGNGRTEAQWKRLKDRTIITGVDKPYSNTDGQIVRSGSRQTRLTDMWKARISK